MQIIGVGRHGHVAFHESGISLKGGKVMLVKLDDNTVANAVADAHFPLGKRKPALRCHHGRPRALLKSAFCTCAEGGSKEVQAFLLHRPEPAPDQAAVHHQVVAVHKGRLIRRKENRSHGDIVCHT